MKYIQWLNQWLEYYIKPSTKERTYNKYARIAHNLYRLCWEIGIWQN